jgi:hypothetical protein
VTEKGSVAAEEQEVSFEAKVVPGADSWGCMTFNPDESRTYLPVARGVALDPVA